MGQERSIANTKQQRKSIVAGFAHDDVLYAVRLNSPTATPTTIGASAENGPIVLADRAPAQDRTPAVETGYHPEPHSVAQVATGDEHLDETGPSSRAFNRVDKVLT